MNLKSAMLKHSRRTLFGKPVEQSWASLKVLEMMLSEYKPDTLLELGTGSGALSMYFKTYASLNKAAFWTLDLNDPGPEELQCLDKAFARADFHDPSVISEYSGLLNTGSRPFLLVDGADPKGLEVNLFSPHLKGGTVVFAHDYITNGAEDRIRWGFEDSCVDWTFVEKLEPWYSLSVSGNTRMLCTRVKPRTA